MTNEFERIDYEKAPWTEIDAALVNADKQIASRDYWLMKCLLQVDARMIYRSAKHKSLYDYMQKRMGWDPHTTAERLRTAKALEDLPSRTERPSVSSPTKSGRLRFTRRISSSVRREHRSS